MAISLQKCDMEIVIYMSRYLLQFEEDQNSGFVFFSVLVLLEDKNAARRSIQAIRL